MATQSEALFNTAEEDRGATFSRCGKYRYSLWRRWDYGKPAVLFVMLNPSTADANQDDPTIRRCIGFAKHWDMGGVRVCNLYGLRATDPRELKSAGADAIQPPLEDWANDQAIRAAAGDAGRIIAAWGAWPGPYPFRPVSVMALFTDRDAPVEALALTKDGSPRHPLYVKGDVAPVPYGRRAAA